SMVDSLLEAADSNSFKRLKKDHIAKYREKFDRVELYLGEQDNNSSTPERLSAFQHNDDPAFAALYFQYGRYLMISGTRENSMPLNLQGLWANQLQAPWNGDYHLNINLQMNYWPAEVTNLSSLAEPLFRFTSDLTKPGHKTAKAYYKSDGWTAHVVSNPWRFTSPGEGANWGSTLTGGAWLCEHIWEHFRFNKDTTFLRNYYPVLKGAAQFLQSILIKEPEHGWLVTAPSNSPENTYIAPDGFKGQTCMGPAMDMQICRELFNACIEASQILQLDKEWREQL